jgi:hypothetical protein
VVVPNVALDDDPARQDVLLLNDTPRSITDRVQQRLSTAQVATYELRLFTFRIRQRGAAARNAPGMTSILRSPSTPWS